MTNTEKNNNTLLHKNPSTGHEVHLCYRCGWPFPNPHPSAKHRRAHKRVCGTIEGFAINQPKSDDDDDDDDNSDDDDNNHHAPSPVIEKTNSKESVIGGVGKMSSKSEDDVFSDAITEFSDGSTGISPQTVDKIVENKSVDKPVNDIVDKAPLLNGSTSTDLVSDAGATVDAKEHPEGITLEADPKAEPLPVEQCNESQPELVKAEIPRDVAVDTNLQIGEGKLPSVTLDSYEAKASDHVTEVVKQDPSILPTTLKEMDTVKEDVISADKTSYAEEPLKCASENGGAHAMTSQEKIDSAIQLTPSSDSPCDLDSGEKPLEQVSRSESSLPDSDSRDDDAKKPSDELHTEQTCDIQVKSDIKQVDPVDIAETSIETAPVIIGSENLTESCNNEIDGFSAEVSTGVSHDGNVAVSTEHLEGPTLSTQELSLLNQKCSEETSSNVEGCTDASYAVPTSVDKPVATENFSFTPPPFISATGDDHGKVVSVDLKSVQDESDLKLTKEIGGVSTVDPSNHSTATSDSMEVNCGSVSEADFQETKTTAEKRDYKKSDDFEPPSFMTLVQSGDKVEKVPAASEIETVQNNLELKSESLQAAWFPSITNLVNESEGRKKNEEKIAKVTNWSPGRQHGPLNNLLNDAKSPNTKQIPATDLKDEEAVKDNGDVATKVNCAPDTEANKEMDEEWDSPARYPIENKKEKKKKGKSFWIPFACCSSVHREL